MFENDVLNNILKPLPLPVAFLPVAFFYKGFNPYTEFEDYFFANILLNTHFWKKVSNKSSSALNFLSINTIIFYPRPNG